MLDELEVLLLAYEERLLDPAIRQNPAAAGALLAEDFREFGSSGRIFDRAAILELLASEPRSARPFAAISDFALTRVSSDTALVTYRTMHSTGSSLRSSLWVCREGRWLLLFHQGTVSAQPGRK